MNGLILALLVAGPTDGRVLIVKARPALKAEAPAHWTKATTTVTAPTTEVVTATTRPRPKAQRRAVRYVRPRTRADYRCLMDTQCRLLVRDIENRAMREARRYRTRRSMASTRPKGKEDRRDQKRHGEARAYSRPSEPTFLVRR